MKKLDKTEKILIGIIVVSIVVIGWFILHRNDSYICRVNNPQFVETIPTTKPYNPHSKSYICGCGSCKNIQTN